MATALSKLIDPDLPRHLDVFAAILIYKFEDTLLPDLIDIFGSGVLPKFLDIFAGTTFVVPSREQIESVLRDVDIYLSMKEGRMTSEELARKHEIGDNTVRIIYGKVRKIVEGIE